MERLLSKDIALDISEKALEYLAKEGYNPQYGARPLKRLIQTKILNHIASLIISEGILKGGTVVVDIKNNDIVFEVKKGKKGFIVDRQLSKV